MGESLIILTQLGYEQITLVKSDGTEQDLMTKLTRDSDIFLFPQGENEIEISDDVGYLELVDFHIEFSPLYLEVQ